MVYITKAISYSNIIKVFRNVHLGVQEVVWHTF